MAQKLYEESNIQAIADAIRGKNGSEDTYRVSEMAEAIDALESRDPSCNGMHIPEEALTIKGNCSYRFSNNGWNWFIEQCGDKIKTEGLENTSYMFQASTNLKSIPFDLNFKNTAYMQMSSMFNGCFALEEMGDINDAYPSDMGSMFADCQMMRYLPNFNNLNLDRIQTYATANLRGMFQRCFSLRSVPEEFLEKLYKPTATSYLYPLLNSGFSNCYALDEIRGLNPQTGTITSNMFSNAFSSCGRLKEIIFKLDDDGNPYRCNWKSQTIEINGVGSVSNYTYITNYNSGLTEATRIVDDATYEQLKDHPDSWTTISGYSRFNRQSAVNMINSLPDVSQGSGNTIKFAGSLGSLTDAGAINTLTSEEIAVATAKGWTVSFI